MKILVDENIPYAHKIFSRLGDVQIIHGRKITAQIVSSYDALIVRSVTNVNQSLLEGSKVRFVGSTTSGIDHIDDHWLEKSGIKFSYAAGCNAIAVVEYVFTALLLLSQRYGFHLRDKTVGIIGVGNIGRLLYQRLNAFGVPTLLCDPPQAEISTIGEWQLLEKLVTEADVLTLHTPLTYHGRHATWHLINEDLLSALPSTKRILINTCRGAVVDNVALLHALKKGKLLSVILDVWEKEPNLSLSLLNNVDIGTAHIAGYSLEGKVRGAIKIFNDYSKFLGAIQSLNVSAFLPAPMIEYVRWHGVINEEELRKLAYLIYDLQFDDILLRRNIHKPHGFDQLRTNYCERREWSSLSVGTDNNISTNMLNQLGFKSILI
ncbi:4-phosphoerythronate dehydrogenase [Candidatus Palibaumannia cicadellinicola]|uniref:Erythronate-4-phosphate dehydrogenase n=1 Tax=Baumannia cicadellinicola subsp. Homalodisca coagulata TaxID=374463 RepID=PDXB_BAUCH|nr:4-phosphoerythronate dehydrogenase [Candidatus Baumannia cicadellinicola]Q1LTA7.1 RecName: Full=Erythronate-4-phosphate dehydrogenase [Baumannia cicadellinicola str. Hc (Homalodisca coagulata)]ABF14137.1 erythronate-4-phosphate dehydrogenase [Baumannia cicadellinicola str. Hc (Homalodisca coagulata)]MCJ7462211.1 4-phosphoerythronate dehydrogenase [Candidatus Baumannia cicadellinicola]MCJ7462729.1 4-phosphoerythronate dehydrogenase [Candidatus Baumannia cicadellinicola]